MKLNYSALKKKNYNYQDLELISIQPKHIEKIRLWRNNQINILRQNKKVTQKKQQSYYNNTIIPSKKSNKPNSILLAIYYKKEFIGYGGFVHISWINNRAEISFLLDSKIKETSTKYSLIFDKFFFIIKNIGINELCFNKLTTETFIYRKSVIKNLESQGFVKEGFFVKQYLKKNLIDSVVHSYFK